MSVNDRSALVERVAVALYEADHPSTPRPCFGELSEDGQRWWRYLAAHAVGEIMGWAP